MVPTAARYLNKYLFINNLVYFIFFNDYSYVHMFYKNMFFYKFLNFKKNTVSNCHVSNIKKVFFLKNFHNLIYFLFDFNHFYFQKNRYINIDNLFLINDRYRSDYKKYKYSIFLPTFILIQFQNFLNLFYNLFFEKKKIFFINNTNITESLNILYFNMFGVTFFRNLIFFTDIKFRWFRLKTWVNKFNKFLKINKISLLIYFSNEYNVFSISFLKKLTLPIFSLIDLRADITVFDYYIMCDIKYKINFYIILLLIFRIFINCLIFFKVNHFWLFYKNNQTILKFF